MYLNFYGLETEPFHMTPDPQFMWLSPTHKEAYSTILYGVEKRKGFVALTGEVGTGKTMILRAYLQQIKGTKVRSIYLLNPGLSFEDFLRTLLWMMGRDARNWTVPWMLNWLNCALIYYFKQQETIVLIVDEAQNMPVSTLEQLRMLTNLETTKEKLLQIVLAGQPELNAKLGRYELRQLAQRIAVRAALRPLTTIESLSYVRHRIAQAGGDVSAILEPAALRLIVRNAKGIPRRLNVLCDNTLVAGYGAQKRPIPARIVRQVLSELDAGTTRRSMRWFSATAGAAARSLVRRPLESQAPVHGLDVQPEAGVAARITREVV